MSSVSQYPLFVQCVVGNFRTSCQYIRRGFLFPRLLTLLASSLEVTVYYAILLIKVRVIFEEIFAENFRCRIE